MKANTIFRRITILLAFGIMPACLAPAVIYSCPVCIGLPEKTVADYLIESQYVVLVREDSLEPFTYATLSVLKGNRPEADFELFIPSSTRRHLKACPDAAVVLVRATASDPWRSLGIADPEYQAVIRRILAFSANWQGESGARTRCEFFIGLLGHDNHAIFELAYLELGRAPYRIIRQVAPLVDLNDLQPFLQRREYYEWRSLAILLLAQHPTPENRKLIDDSFYQCKRFSLSTHLAAWTTAYIELHGQQAIAEIEHIWFRDESRSAEEMRAVTLALAAHGVNESEFGDTKSESIQPYPADQ